MDKEPEGREAVLEGAGPESPESGVRVGLDLRKTVIGSELEAGWVWGRGAGVCVCVCVEVAGRV